MPLQRSFNAGQFAVELDNEVAGWVQSVEGGMPSADVVSEKIGHDVITHKHIGPIKYDEISLKCGTGMSRGFYTWIQRSLGKDFLRQSGAIITADYNYTEVARLNFYEALITEFTMPALDATSKDPATMSIKFSPEYTRRIRGGGAPIAGKFATQQAVQKHWLPANFRVHIDGLDRPCARVSKVEALSVKQKVTEVATTNNRDLYREPAAIEYSNLVITLPEADAEPFYKWFDEFVIQGKCTPEREKTASVEFLTPSLKETLYTVSLSNVGIFKISPDKLEAGSSSIRRVKIEMYCEQMTFDVGEMTASTWA